MKPALVTQAWEYYTTVQTKDQKYTPLVRPEDKPATFLNAKIMATYREKMKPFYFDPSRFKTYLEQLGVPAWEAERTIERFRMHDAQTLQRQHAVYHDERRLIQTSREAAAELQGLFESDLEEGERAARGTFSPSDVR